MLHGAFRLIGESWLRKTVHMTGIAAPYTQTHRGMSTASIPRPRVSYPSTPISILNVNVQTVFKEHYYNYIRQILTSWRRAQQCSSTGFSSRPFLRCTSFWVSYEELSADLKNKQRRVSLCVISVYPYKSQLAIYKFRPLSKKKVFCQPMFLLNTTCFLILYAFINCQNMTISNIYNKISFCTMDNVAF